MPCFTSWSRTRKPRPNEVRYRAGTTLLIVILLAGFGVEWGRSLLRHREALPAPAVSEPYALLLGPGFPRPGVYQFSDAQSPRSVIKMTNLSVAPELLDDPCLDFPLVTGSALDILVKNAIIQDVVVSWMPAGQRLALGIPLHPDRMEWHDWEILPGIGPTLARRIERNRQENGEFGSLEALVRVRGVGKKRIAAWKGFFEK
jgi:competence protein ComEA